ncbi:MAG: TonB-dependent receptor [Caulobacterales bacterium]|nr:TonB-dependent receptor [Caulobacterales bacterium]
MIKTNPLKAVLAGTVCAFALAGAAAAQTRSFDVAAGELQIALESYARQAGIQLVYRIEDIRGLRTRGVHGEADAEAALARLLADTGLTIQRDTSGAIAIVHGAPQDSPEADAATVDDVVVTGSRLRSTFDSPTPVVAIEREELLEQGYMDVAEALTDTPGIQESGSLANSQTATHANGLSTVDLRGLGTNRTLTLIDGHRTVSNSVSSNTVSLSTIPELFIDRIEVTTGGGSAIYGADAIAGVVNVITQRNLQGVRARIVAGSTSDGGGDSVEYSIAAGQRFLDDRLRVMIGATLDRQFRLAATERDFALESISYQQASNTIITPDLSTSIAGGRFNSGRWFYNESGLRPNMDTAVDGYEIRNESTLITPRDILNGAARFDFDLTNDIRLWGQVMYSQVTTNSERAHGTISNTSTFGVNDEFTLGRLSRTLHPFAPTEIRTSAPSAGIDFRRRMVEVGPNRLHNERETIRTWFGAEGTIWGDWDWDVTFGYAVYNGNQIRGNTFNMQRVQWALDSENVGGVIQCRSAVARADGCVPLNIFGVGSITPQMANYIRANTRFSQETEQYTFEAYIAGSPFELPAGPVETSFGVTSRRDSTATTGDPLILSGLASSSYLPEFEGEVGTNEIFGEASIPLLADIPGFHRLVLNTALRVANYDLEAVGTTYSYRAGLQWQPFADLRIRTEYARAQRAPDLSELFSPPRDDADTVTDICHGITATTTGVIAQNCRADPRISAAIAAAADGTFRQVSRTIQGPNAGNPNLFEETADTWTVGLVYRPSFLSGLEVSIDYYDIQISDVITSLSNEAILTGCYASSGAPTNEYCAIITRSADGQLVRILNQEDNLNGMQASGIDLALDYRFSLDHWQIPGDFRASLIYTHRLELSTEYNNLNSIEVVEEVGEIGSAEHEARFNLRWSDENWSVRWTTRYIGEVVDSLDRVEQAQTMGWSDPLYLYIGNYWRHDLSASVTPIENDPRIRIFGSIRNIFNEYGPFLPTGTVNGREYNNHSSYGVMGRSLSVGVQFEF